jgi:ActR/RegA family two-component response regulator
MTTGIGTEPGLRVESVHLLIVDDEDSYLERAKRILVLPGLVEVSTCRSPEEVRSRYGSNFPFQVAILDVNLGPGKPFVPLRLAIKEHRRTCQIVIFSDESAPTQARPIAEWVTKTAFDDDPDGRVLCDAVLGALHSFMEADQSPVDIERISRAYEQRRKGLVARLRRAYWRCTRYLRRKLKGRLDFGPRPDLGGLASRFWRTMSESFRARDVSTVEGRMDDPEHSDDYVQVSLEEVYPDGSREYLPYLMPRALFPRKFRKSGAGFRVISYMRGRRFVARIAATKVDRSKIDALLNDPIFQAIEQEERARLSQATMADNPGP